VHVGRDVSANTGVDQFSKNLEANKILGARRGPRTEHPQILGAIVKIVVAVANCRPGFVQPCANISEGTRLTSRSDRFTPRRIDSDMHRVGDWQSLLRRRSAVARLLGSQLRTPLREWMIFLSCVGCMLCR